MVHSPSLLWCLIGQIYISYSYFLLRGKGEPAAVLLIFLLLSVFATCIHLHLHSSINSSSQRACVPLLSLPSCLYDTHSVLPGAHVDIRVTLGFMRHVMVCAITVFTPQCVSVFFCTKPTKTYNVWVNVHDSYSAGECFPVVCNKGWMYDCDVCLVSLFILLSGRACVFVCGRVRETVWILFGLIWCDWAPLSLFTHLFSSELTVKQ